MIVSRENAADPASPSVANGSHFHAASQHQSAGPFVTTQHGMGHMLLVSRKRKAAVLSVLHTDSGDELAVVARHMSVPETIANASFANQHCTLELVEPSRIVAQFKRELPCPAYYLNTGR